VSHAAGSDGAKVGLEHFLSALGPFLEKRDGRHPLLDRDLDVKLAEEG
jgi:hypothetical protein